ncbi:hypothetical protein AXF42_Ash004406 [Apostasia shenzhenica]|uniref:Uncharacterized protein n=1 Tax=Apostasia shenzhenica TaxID=1088818 RepID=A0A2I0A2V4_9ASPA|nr:hypothetical protein AXF42_Ash004406 [Apostasia shenzhenica]
MEFRRINSPFDCLLFDLDDTLYHSGTGIAVACKRNIDEFLAMKCSVSAERASHLRVELFKTYGSSLAGLILFTNSDRKHASRVLKRLGIEEECFQVVICFETLNPELFRLQPASSAVPPAAPVVLKPIISAFEAAIRIAGFDPQRMLFLDDSERNIAAGKAAGLRTAVVGRRTKTVEADYAVEDLFRLRSVIPEIWGEKLPPAASVLAAEEVGGGGEGTMMLGNEAPDKALPSPAAAAIEA